jgi:alpha-tubulin suppressor-like RCC1 family protein
MVDTSPLPVPVSALDNVLAITTGVHVTCAVTEDDDAWCWGLDWNGVLGTTEVDSGATTSTPLKVEFPEGVSIKDIVLSVGRDGPTACALSRAGSVYCWGSNGYGQVADGTTTHREMPTEVEGMSGGDRLSVGFYQFSLLKTEGSIHVWGNCEHCGCFGAEPVGGWDDCAGISCSMNPYEILSEDDGYAIADTASGVRGYAGFLDQSGSAWGWGRNAYGELGTGDNDGGDGLFCEVDGADWPYFEMPQQVALDVELTQVSFGHYHGCAIDVDGNAWCWGRNDDGELGIGRGNALDEFGGFECSFTPMKVLDPYGAE